MTPHVTDLFGEVPVTWPEVWAWIEAVAGITRDSPRADAYIRNWSVPDKIRHAKMAGQFDEVINAAPRPSPFWWSRFRWS